MLDFIHFKKISILSCKNNIPFLPAPFYILHFHSEYYFLAYFSPLPGRKIKTLVDSLDLVFWSDIITSRYPCIFIDECWRAIAQVHEKESNSCLGHIIIDILFPFIK